MQQSIPAPGIQGPPAPGAGRASAWPKTLSYLIIYFHFISIHLGDLGVWRESGVATGLVHSHDRLNATRIERDEQRERESPPLFRGGPSPWTAPAIPVSADLPYSYRLSSSPWHNPVFGVTTGQRVVFCVLFFLFCCPSGCGHSQGSRQMNR